MNDILNTLADIQRRLRRLEALGERRVSSTLDGSGTAGQVVTWVTATTLGSSGYAGSAVTRYTGVPTAGRVVTWAGNGTVQDALTGRPGWSTFERLPTCRPLVA